MNTQDLTHSLVQVNTTLDPKTSQSHNGYSNAHAPLSHAHAQSNSNETYLWASPQIASPPPPNANPTKRFIEFTFCHDIFPNTAYSAKDVKYNPPIQALRSARWQVNPFITITTVVKGDIYEQSIKELERLKIPKMKSEHS